MENKTKPKHPGRCRKKIVIPNSVYLQASWCFMYKSDIKWWARDPWFLSLTVSCCSSCTETCSLEANGNLITWVQWDQDFSLFVFCHFWDTLWNNAAESLWFGWFVCFKCSWTQSILYRTFLKWVYWSRDFWAIVLIIFLLVLIFF